MVHLFESCPNPPTLLASRPIVDASDSMINEGEVKINQKLDRDFPFLTLRFSFH